MTVRKKIVFFRLSKSHRDPKWSDMVAAAADHTEVSARISSLDISETRSSLDLLRSPHLAASFQAERLRVGEFRLQVLGRHSTGTTDRCECVCISCLTFYALKKQCGHVDSDTKVNSEAISCHVQCEIDFHCFDNPFFLS